jgi:prepilin-type N-terminal cleavage/methylation domain-containing protein
LSGIRGGAGREAGFTIVELVATMAITAIVLTFGAFAVKHYWYVRSLQTAQDTVVTALRSVQQRSISESHPNVYGVRFLKGTSNFGVVRYDASAATPTCTPVTQQQLGNGTLFSADADTDFPDVAVMTAACRDAAPASPDYEVVFFYARGSTNASSSVGSVELSQPQVDRTKEIAVSRLTGRVTTL